MTALAVLLALTAVLTGRPRPALTLAALVAAVQLWPLLLAVLAGTVAVAVLFLAAVVVRQTLPAPDYPPMPDGEPV